ncbi:MAG: FHA domain-containing protein [Deltaproteobacteria bacterium]|nr:FHA domain-containing protein [Deltaproteobacteria bacterium]
MRNEAPRPPVPGRELSLSEPTPTPRELFADEDLSDGRKRRSRGPAVKDEQKQRLELASLQTLAADGETAVLTGKAEGMLVVEQGAHKGTHVDLSEGKCTIGRSSKCTLALRLGSGISRNHAQVTFVDGLYYIEDLGSRNGTVLNGHEVEGQVVLRDRDLIEVSQEQLRFYGPMPEGEDLELPPDDASLQAALFAKSLDDEVTPPKRKKRKKGAPYAKQKMRKHSSQERSQFRGNRVMSATQENMDQRIEASIQSGPSALASSTAPTMAPTQVPVVLPVSRGRNAGLVAFGGLVGLFLALGLVVAWDALLNDSVLLDEVMGAPAKKESVLAEVSAAAIVDEELAADDLKIGEPARAADAIKPESEEKKEVVVKEALVAKEASDDDKNVPSKAVGVEKSIDEPGVSAEAFQTYLAGVRGKVVRIKVAAGQTFQKGDVLLHYRRRAKGSVARKLKTLRGEERDFLVYARKGNVMAKESLREVQKRIRILEKKTNMPYALKAVSAGRIGKLSLKKGQKLRSKTPIFDFQAC